MDSSGRSCATNCRSTETFGSPRSRQQTAPDTSTRPNTMSQVRPPPPRRRLHRRGRGGCDFCLLREGSEIEATRFMFSVSGTCVFVLYDGKPRMQKNAKTQYWQDNKYNIIDFKRNVAMQKLTHKTIKKGKT